MKKDGTTSTEIAQPLTNQPRIQLPSSTPLVYESICLVPLNGPSVTSDARRLLRLIDRNPSLATCIRDLEYHDPDSDDLPLEDQYSRELKHDHKIFSQFAEELAQKSSTVKKFGYSSEPSQLRKMSVVYDKTCIPLLLSRLPNLRSFTFNGRVGGKIRFFFSHRGQRQYGNGCH
jgi:hypothetical protein